MAGPKIRQLLIQEQEVMNGFCFAFANALLQKIIKLDDEDRIFEGGKKEVAKLEITVGKNYCARRSAIARLVFNHLSGQFPTLGDGENCRQLREYIDTAREFLAIFEKK